MYSLQLLYSVFATQPQKDLVTLFFEHVEMYSGAYSVLVSGVVALATLRYVKLTHELVKQGRRDSIRPIINVVLEQETPDRLLLKTENLGVGLAMDIRIRVYSLDPSKDQRLPPQKQEELPPHIVPSLQPGQKNVKSYGSSEFGVLLQGWHVFVYFKDRNYYEYVFDFLVDK